MKNSLQTEDSELSGTLTAQCADQRTCVSCMDADLHNDVYFEDGDLFVVGFAPIFDKSIASPIDCSTIRTHLGVELAEGMAYAVKLVNEKKGQYANYFPGKKIGFAIFNTCDQPLRGKGLLLSLLQDGLKHRNGSVLKVQDKILGFVGEYTSIMSKTISEILSEFNFVQVGYAALATFLGDRVLYPYFARVGTPENKLMDSLVRLVKDVGSSNYAQILYSEGVYGESIRDAVKERAKDRGLCIAAEHVVKEGEHYNKIIQDLRKKPYAQVVIVNLHSFVLVDVLNALYPELDQGESLFVAGLTWSNRIELIEHYPYLAGSFSIALEIIEKPGFREYLNNISVVSNSSNPWRRRYFEEKNQCYLPGSFEKAGRSPCTETRLAPPEYKFELWTMHALNAMLALIGGTNDAYRLFCGTQHSGICDDYRNNPNEVYRMLVQQKLVIDSSGDLIRIFDDNGDGSVGATIYQCQKVKDDPTRNHYLPVSHPLNEL